MEGCTVFERVLCTEEKQRRLAKVKNIFTLFIQHFSIINIESDAMVQINMNTLVKISKVIFSRMKMQRSNLETFTSNRSGVSPFQPSLEKKNEGKKEGKNQQTPPFFGKVKQVIPGMVPHTALCIRALWRRHFWFLCQTRQWKHIVSVGQKFW